LFFAIWISGYISANNLFLKLFQTIFCSSLFQVLQDRVESLTKNIQDLEGKAQSLQLTIDRLSSALARTEEEENTQKEKVSEFTYDQDMSANLSLV
jgi:regulator of replication initiation timing